GPAPAGDDREVDLRLSEGGALRRVADVARERELAATAEREAVDGGDRRLGHRVEQACAVVSERPPGMPFEDAHLGHLLDVRPGRECPLPGTGEDDDARLRVGRELLQPVAQLREQLAVQGVQGVLPVDREHDHAVLVTGRRDRHSQPARVTALARKSTISLVGAPGVKTAETPRRFSSSASASGIVPPTTTSTSSAPFSRRPSRIRGTSVMCAPDRIEMPTASASSWIAVSTICSGVW